MALSNGNVTRRGFLTGAAALGAAGAAGALTGCGGGSSSGSSGSSGSDGGVRTVRYTWEQKPEVPTDIIDTIDCDIVVVGAGIAGLGGALKAADEGVDVHVLEKGESIGLSREMTMAVNSKIQLDAGVMFTREMRDAAFEQYYTKSSIQTGLVGAVQDNHWQTAEFLDTSGPWMDWLAPILIEEGIDVHFAGTPQEYAGIPLALSYGKGGNPPDDWQDAIKTAFEKRGGVIDFHAAGYMLVQDESTGAVTGIIAKNDDGYVQYNTRLGVLLACGGISNDPDMMDAMFWGNSRVTKHFAYPTHTGDGHKMALWAGASIDEIYWADPFTTSIHTDIRPTRVGSDVEFEHFDDSWPAAPGVGQLGMLWLDVYGRRFTDEAEDLCVGTTAILNQEKGVCWSLWDSAWEERVGHLIPEGYQPCMGRFVTWFAMNTQAQIDADVESGITMKFDTLEEVAEATGMDYDTMMAEIERYNGFCAQGHDDDHLKDPNWLAPVDTPPYYVAGMGMAECITRGGVHVDRHCRAIATDGSTIDGLWAAGTGASGTFGLFRMMGSVPIGQNSAWRAVCDMLGQEPPRTDWSQFVMTPEAEMAMAMAMSGGVLPEEAAGVEGAAPAEAAESPTEG